MNATSPSIMSDSQDCNDNNETMLFQYYDAGSLREYYKALEGIDDFCERAFLLSHGKRSGDIIRYPQTINEGDLVIQDTALYQALSVMLTTPRKTGWADQKNECMIALINSLIDSATDILDEKKDLALPVEPDHWEVSRAYCRSWLAQAFLCNLVGDPVAQLKPSGVESSSGLNFGPLFWDTGHTGIAVEKCKCLVNYFLQTCHPLHGFWEEIITFDRVSLSMEPFTSIPAWNNVTFPPEGSQTDSVLKRVTTQGMETDEAHAMVNFANSVFGVGEFFSDSATQEEILQMCCPEFNLGMLVFGQLHDDTVVVARNIRRFSLYSGYDSTFSFHGTNKRTTDPQTFIVMDASIIIDHEQQFSLESNWRDIRKAYLGFLASAATSVQLSGGESFLKLPRFLNSIIVSTGKWGCGAFGGNVVLKFLQQIVAAQLVWTDAEALPSAPNPLVSLLYSSYHNAELKSTLEQVYDDCQGLTPHQLLHCVLIKPELFPSDGVTRDQYSKLFHTLRSIDRA
eukprot:scaffold21965_cov55-Attheya_sp.AAC.2